MLEAEEYFSPGQKGSSAMPHKRNPILTENLTGQARMIRGYALPALENVALWHERDISHSSVERFIGPDATITLDFALARLTGVIDKLLVYPERMQKNLDRMGGLVHSQRVLLALTQAGISREDAYRAGPAQRDEGVGIGRSSCRCSTCSRPMPKSPPRMTDDELEEKFDLDYHFKQVDTIFDRVFRLTARDPSQSGGKRLASSSNSKDRRQADANRPHNHLGAAAGRPAAVLHYQLEPVEVKIWEGIVVETKIPAMVIVSFAIGFVPMWLYHRASKWRLQRRIQASRMLRAPPPQRP